MIVGFPLTSRLIDCPVPWQNFIRDLQQQGFRDRDVAMPVIQHELKKYGAKYRVGEDHEPGDFVVFEDEQHLTLFNLKWS